MPYFQCPHCGWENRAPAGGPGAARSCPRCGREVVTPEGAVQKEPGQVIPPGVAGRGRDQDLHEEEALAKAAEFRARVAGNYAKAYVVIAVMGGLFLFCCVLPGCLGLLESFLEDAGRPAAGGAPPAPPR